MAFTEGEFEDAMHEIMIDSIERAPGEKASLSLQLPAAFVILMEPVTHAAHFFDVKGEPVREPQTCSIVYNNVAVPAGTTSPAPGPFRLSFENRTTRRMLPSVWIAGDELHRLLGGRKPFLTAKRLLWLDRRTSAGRDPTERARAHGAPAKALYPWRVDEMAVYEIP